MSFAVAIMTPLAIALPAPAGVDTAAIFAGEPVASPTVAEPGESAPKASPERPRKVTTEGWTLHFDRFQFQPEAANQVRIEQRVTIRINPRNESTQQSMFAELPDREIGPRFVERKIGECVKVSQISGVQTDVGNRLLLFMSDRTIVSAMLERACRARDFYSGFYLAKTKDGKLCVARDSLQSRSGANCKITRIRELVEVGN